MRDFEKRSSRLAAMSGETRLIYTAYLLFTFFAYMVIGILVWQRTGISQNVYVDYYVGNEAREVYGKSFAELLELTHFHLFSYPLFLLVQGHVFLMCRWPSRGKGAIVMASFVGAALYLAAPWLVLYAGEGWVWVKTLGRTLLVPPLLLFLFVPLIEMWLPHKPRART